MGARPRKAGKSLHFLCFLWSDLALLVPKPDKLEPKKAADCVGRMSAALSDMEVSEGATLIRPTTALHFHSTRYLTATLEL